MTAEHPVPDEPQADEPAAAEPAAAEPAAAEPAAAEPAAAIERDEVRVHVRTSPRYGRLMALGALVGLIVGWILGMVGEPDEQLGRAPMVAFLIVTGIVVGIALGGAVAILLDRLVGRKRRDAVAERTRHHG